MIAEWRKRWRAGVLRRRKAYIMTRYANELHYALRNMAMPTAFHERNPSMTYEQSRRCAATLARMCLSRLDFELRAAEHDKRIVRVKVKV
jgi:hypothetical protein